MVKGAEVAGRHGDSPRSIQEVSALQAAKQSSVSVEDSDRTESRTVLFVVAAGCLLGKRNYQVSADILDTERCEAVAINSLIVGAGIESAGSQQSEIAVENVNASGQEIRGVKEDSIRCLRQCASLVNGLTSALHLEYGVVAIH